MLGEERNEMIIFSTFEIFRSKLQVKQRREMHAVECSVNSNLDCKCIPFSSPSDKCSSTQLKRSTMHVSIPDAKP